jgi:hypothetical protein
MALAVPARAAVVGYELVSGDAGAARSNGLVDVTPLGACAFSIAAGNLVPGGCVDRAGEPCPTDAPCDLRRVPAGRCSYGGNLGCLWPNGAGFCDADPNRACVGDGDCASGTCNPATNDPACACQGTTPGAADFETAVCGGPDGVCSDGDGAFPAAFGLGAGVCTAANVGVDWVRGCGEEAGQSLTGPRFALENPPHVPLSQRRPGLGSKVAPPTSLVAPRTTFAYDLGPIEPARGGVRRIALLADSFFQDFRFLDAGRTGGLADLHAVAHLCRPPPGWTPSAPIAGGSYCHELGSDSVGYVWTQSVDPANPALKPPALDLDMDGAPDCPPHCGRDYDLDSLEWLALDAVASLDPNAGAQLALEAAEGGPPIAGERLEVARGAVAIWAASSDLRCTLGGDPDVVCAPCASGTCGESGLACTTSRDCRLYVGRCSGSAQACDPAGGGTSCPSGQTCRGCYGAFAIGVCTNAPTACRVDADCPGGLCGDANGAPLHPRVGAPNPLALPVGYDTHGIAELELETKCSPARPGRIGGIAGSAITAAVPFTALLTTGNAASRVRDPDVAAAPLDTAPLGLETGAQVGIAEPGAPEMPLAGGSYAVGRSFPVGGSCCAATGTVTGALLRVGAAPAPQVTANPGAISWPSGAPGAIAVPLLRASSFGAGADRTPGCPGDSSGNASAGALPDPGPCNDPLGAAARVACAGSDCEGNTGADDARLFAPIGAAPPVPAVRARGLTGSPASPAPVLVGVAALAGFDVDFAAAENLDFSAKLDLRACPLVGACSSGAACLVDAHCAGGVCGPRVAACGATTLPTDFDSDGVPDTVDRCETIPDSGSDTDQDGVDDACDTCTIAANPPLAGAPTTNRTFVSHQRDDDADGRGNRCDFDYDNLAAGIGAPDVADMVASISRPVTQSTCGSAADQRCGEFDHDGIGAGIGAGDVSLLVPAIGKSIAVHFPKCSACATGAGWSNSLGSGGERLGRPVCQSAVPGACVYAP